LANRPTPTLQDEQARAGSVAPAQNILKLSAIHNAEVQETSPWDGEY
jgi:hypothetical protein